MGVLWFVGFFLLFDVEVVVDDIIEMYFGEIGVMLVGG